MKGSIFFRLFCEIPFVFHVFLVNFSRDFGARPAKIVSVVHALCLTAVFSWGNNELKGNVKTCISGEIHRIHKWPPRGTVWNLAHEIEVGKASVK